MSGDAPTAPPASRLVRLWSGLRRVLHWPPVRLLLLTVYYLAVLITLLWMYGTSRYTPPPFIYQGF